MLYKSIARSSLLACLRTPAHPQSIFNCSELDQFRLTQTKPELALGIVSLFWVRCRLWSHLNPNFRLPFFFGFSRSIRTDSHPLAYSQFGTQICAMGQPVSASSLISIPCAIKIVSASSSSSATHHLPERSFTQSLTPSRVVCLRYKIAQLQLSSLVQIILAPTQNLELCCAIQSSKDVLP